MGNRSTSEGATAARAGVRGEREGVIQSPWDWGVSMMSLLVVVEVSSVAILHNRSGDCQACGGKSWRHRLFALIEEWAAITCHLPRARSHSGYRGADARTSTLTPW